MQLRVRGTKIATKRHQIGQSIARWKSDVGSDHVSHVGLVLQKRKNKTFSYFL